TSDRLVAGRAGEEGPNPGQAIPLDNALSPVRGRDGEAREGSLSRQAIPLDTRSLPQGGEMAEGQRGVPFVWNNTKTVQDVMAIIKTQVDHRLQQPPA
ncbi:MAG: hypothetical protein ACHQ7M_07600, partial [Chloroflexota bacterium]